MTNLPYVDFELNVGPGSANKQHCLDYPALGRCHCTSRYRNTMWCVLSGQNEGVGHAVRHVPRQQQQYGDKKRDCFDAPALMLHIYYIYIWQVGFEVRS